MRFLTFCLSALIPSLWIVVATQAQSQAATLPLTQARDPQSDEFETMSRIATVWRLWALEQDAPKTALAIGHNGAVIFRDGIGMAADTRVNLASLSKSIAAVCLGTMMAERRLPFDLTLATLAPVLGRVDIPVPEHATRMSVAQLITHTSGMNPDTTQGSRALARGRANKGPVDIDYAQRALRELAVSGRRGQYFYNNGNYALMGGLMSALSDDLEYENDCRDRVLTPTGATEISYEGPLGGLGAWGGWHGSAEQYLKFALSWFGQKRPLAQSPEEFPIADVYGDERYGMGMSYYGEHPPYFISHHGTICSRDGLDNTSTIFFVTRDGWSVSFNTAHCMGDDQSDLHEHFVSAIQ